MKLWELEFVVEADDEYEVTMRVVSDQMEVDVIKTAQKTLLTRGVEVDGEPVKVTGSTLYSLKRICDINALFIEGSTRDGSPIETN